MSKMTIGSDPEFMLATSKGAIVSAIPVLKGDKHKKTDLGDGFVVYYDNTMLETCVPAADSKDGFLKNIRETYARIAGVLGNDYQVFAVPSHYFQKDECEHPDAKLAGCNPEFCVYTNSRCLPPDFVDTFRSAGGHIHIGRDDFRSIDDEECSDEEFLIGSISKRNMIKAMDLFVGLALVLIDSSEASKERKRLYGKAGRFRPTPYGVEYRTPSNYWLSSPVLAELIYDLTAAAYEVVRTGAIQFGEVTDKAFDVINGNDTDGAAEMLATYVKSYDTALYDRIMEVAKFTPAPVYGEWQIA